jgi:hypothetical protein
VHLLRGDAVAEATLRGTGHVEQNQRFQACQRQKSVLIDF